jgi:hypothetical protein
MKIDLHVHTLTSPGGVSSHAAVIRRAIRCGLDGIAVTDHNRIAGVAEARALAPPGFLVIPGVEYSTDHGHILALFCETFANDLRRDGKKRYLLSELCPFIRGQGGLLIASHPYQHAEYRDGSASHGLSESLLRQIDGLESVNGRALSRDPGSCAKTEAAAKDLGLIVTGGSDAHFTLEIGRCCTVFPPDTGRNLPALRDALIRGVCTAEGEPGQKWHRAASKILGKVRSIA